MKSFRIQQKFWSLSGRFMIFDQLGECHYQVKGSLFCWLKSFDIQDASGRPVSYIQQGWSWFLPRFQVTLADGTTFRIQKKWTFLKDWFTIDNLGLEVRGDYWDMNFSLLKEGVEVARISQEWLVIPSTYQVDVYETDYADLVISLVIAIDYVKELANRN